MDTRQNEQQQDKRPFSRLRLYYLSALGAIALSIVLAQVLVQRHLHGQEGDAHLINMAGRQRMLAQQLARTALELNAPEGFHHRQTSAKRLDSIARAWQEAHHVLVGQDRSQLPLAGADRRVVALLTERCAPHVEAVANTSSKISLRLADHSPLTDGQLSLAIAQIQAHVDGFLQAMDRVVTLLEKQATSKVARLRQTEYALFGVALLIIILEVLLIFMPTTRRINQTLAKLIKSEQDAQQMSKEIGALYSSLEASYEKISAISIPVSSPTLVARADRGGNITEVFPSFTRMLDGRPVAADGTVAQLMGMEGDVAESFMDDLIEAISDGGNAHREAIIKGHGGDSTYLDVHIVPIYADNGQVAHLNIMAADLTAKRLAEQGIYRKDRAEIERKINAQKFRSVLVLEGQEEERKRIAMNIHDGIGQLLTSLKFQLASIDIGKHEEARSKLEEINHLVRDVIQEVRRVTFNLNPPVLSDYGLAAGLKTLAHEIDRTSQAVVMFRNDTDFSQRMSSKVENNVFRIVQEALNNAIKYAASERIDLVLQHDDAYLVVTVQDFGRGFEKQVTDIVHTDFGHGFLNMRERAAYINGVLDIQSEKDRGTIVKLFVPLASNPTVL